MFYLTCVEEDFKFKSFPIFEYKLKDIIYDNINDNNNRYLFLEIDPTLVSLIYKDIINQNKEKQIFFYEGSPFIDDYNNEYLFKTINDIKVHIEKGHLIVLKNLEKIYSFFYDLFDMNFVVRDGKKYVHLKDELINVNDNFRCIIMMDKKYISEVENHFLSRFEKQKITFNKLLNTSQNNIFQIIIKDLNIKEIIENKNIYYKIKDLLMGLKKNYLKGLIYLYSNESNYNPNIIKVILFKNIYKLLPQDIIVNLPDKHKINAIYIKYNNLLHYINNIKESNEKRYKISIIYTFSNIYYCADGVDENNAIMISEITNEQQFKNCINNKIKFNHLTNKNNFIFIHFEQKYSYYLSYIIPFIKNNYGEQNYRFILIVHIKRNFTENKIDNIYIEQKRI